MLEKASSLKELINTLKEIKKFLLPQPYLAEDSVTTPSTRDERSEFNQKVMNTPRCQSIIEEVCDQANSLSL